MSLLKQSNLTGVGGYRAGLPTPGAPPISNLGTHAAAPGPATEWQQ
jgi:hypothetical protein